ncbi:MAG: hypothetical protein AAF689_16615 [Pseudomonadota bacterium]
MTREKTFALTLAFCVGFVGAAHAQSFSDVLGRTLTNEQGSVVIQSNGTLSGTLGGQTLRGTWDVVDGLFCRQGSLGTQTIERACQTVRMGGNTISFVNSDGQVSSRYDIN